MKNKTDSIRTKHCERCNGSGEVEGYGGKMIYCGLCGGSGRILDTAAPDGDKKALSEPKPAAEMVVLDRLRELFATDEYAIRKFWSEHFPERELEQLANLYGFSFD